MLIIFLLKSDLNYWLWALLICIVGFALSNLYIYLQNKKRFVANAPKNVLKTNQEGLATAKDKKKKVCSELGNLGEI